MHRTVRRRDDEGSLVLALLASVIVLGLVIILSATAMAGQRTARHDRDFASAFQAADAGLNRAVYLLSAQRQAASPMSGSDAFGAVTYTWTATRVASREWSVASSGTSRGVTRRLVATVLEDKRFFSSAFADVSVTFNGNNTADSYSSSPARKPAPGRLGLIGSNGPVSFLGSSSTVDGVQLWNYAADSSPGRCSGNAAVGLMPTITACSSAAAGLPTGGVPYQQRLNERRLFSPSTDDLNERIAACGPGPYPDLNTSNGNGNASVLKPQTSPSQSGKTVGPSGGRPGYYCYNNVLIDKDTTVDSTAPAATRDNPVVMYVAGDVTINKGRLNCPTCVNDKDSSPDAGALQIYMTGTGVFKTSSQNKISLALTGPRASCGGGAGAEIYGSLVCSKIDNVGGWSFHYDEALEALGNAQFSITRVQER